MILSRRTRSPRFEDKPAEDREEEVTILKHDPYCDCGVCPYCGGLEDKYGNQTKNRPIEVCSSCGGIGLEPVPGYGYQKCPDCDSLPAEGPATHYTDAAGVSDVALGFIVGGLLVSAIRGDKTA